MDFQSGDFVVVRSGVGLHNEGMVGEVKRQFGHYTYIVELLDNKREVLLTRSEIELYDDEEELDMDDPRNHQIGGDHYKDQGIQPIDYIMANELDFCEGNVVKYVTRWRYKNGLQDLKKARHYLDFLIAEQEDLE